MYLALLFFRIWDVEVVGAITNCTKGFAPLDGHVDVVHISHDTCNYDHVRDFCGKP